MFIYNMSFRQLFISWKFNLKIFTSKILTPPPPGDWIVPHPLMTNHRMSSLAIIRALKDTT